MPYEQVDCADGYSVPDIGMNSCWEHNDYLDDNRIFSENQASCMADGLVWIGSIDNPRQGYCGVEGEELAQEEFVEEEFDPCEGVRCIMVYKPCEEGYMEASECCPNTGDCIPDPEYVAVDDPVLPVGQTPSTAFEEVSPIAYSSPSPVERTAVNAPVNTSVEPETSTKETPEEGGLGILAFGLIALKVLAT